MGRVLYFRPAFCAGSDDLANGYDGPPKIHAKAEEQDPAYFCPAVLSLC